MKGNRGYRIVGGVGVGVGFRGFGGGFVLGAVFALGLALLPVPALAAGRQISDLGTLGGSTAFARDVNEPGQIVGESTTARGQTHAFLLTPWVGKMVDLGTLGGTFSQAMAVSNRGQVAGTSTLTGDAQTRAFVWDQGKMTALPPLDGAMFSEGLDVNDSGVVVGQSAGAAVRWQNGHVQSLGTLGGDSSFATGINASGVIIGNGSTAAGDFHGWVFKNGVMTDLGGFGGANSSADGINSAGDIVGHFEVSAGTPHGYLLSNGVFRDLGVLDLSSNANAISNSGLIVGEGSGPATVHALLWDYNRAIIDLGVLPGSNFSSASSVNSAGTIVGVSALDTGFRAVVWR
jgi:probable HAF family extracellular repeat protein